MQLRQLKLVLHPNAFLVLFYDGLSDVSIFSMQNISGPSLTGLNSTMAKKSPKRLWNGIKRYHHGGILCATFRYSTDWISFPFRSHLSFSFMSPLRAYGHCTGTKISSREVVFSVRVHIRSHHIISYHINIYKLFQSIIQRTIPPWIYSSPVYISTAHCHCSRPIRTCLPSRELLSSRTWRLDWSMSWAMISVSPWMPWTVGFPHRWPRRYHERPLPSDSHRPSAKPCCLRLELETLGWCLAQTWRFQERNNLLKTCPKMPGEVDRGSACDAWHPDISDICWIQTPSISHGSGICGCLQSLLSTSKPAWERSGLERSYHDLASHSILLCPGF